VKNQLPEFAPADRRPTVKNVLLEALLVVVVGAAFALAANRISPRGLALSRNYFPAGTHNLVAVAPTAGRGPNAAGTNAAALSPAELLAAELKEKGLQLIDQHKAVQFFRDPRRQQGAVVFVDARDEQRYRAGHIPGAYEFDPYRPEKYFDTVLPVCQAAEQIVVYCNGGDCDDSETAALLLRDVGIANQKLMVYGGGIKAWTANNLPVELGDRNSGNLRNTGQ